MKPVGEVLVEELDPETAAVCAEVCEALEWFDASVPGSVEYLRDRAFGERWWIAWRYSRCRGQIDAALDALVRADGELIRTVQGQCFTRRQVGEYQGRIVHERQDDGVLRSALHWPTGWFVTGEPSYERREAT